MSTILDALKKAEQDSRPTETQSRQARQVSFPKMESEPVTGSGVKPKRWKLVIAGCLIILFAGIVVLLFTGPWFKKEQNASSVKVHQKSDVVAGSHSRSVKTPVMKTDIESDKPGNSEYPDISKKTVLKTQLIHPEKAVEAPNPANSSKSAPVPPPSAQKESPKRINTQPDPPIQPTKVLNDIDAALLENEALKLQAISWSDSPENRIAVISDKILGENDRIEGYKIERIDKDLVIIEKNGKRFKLVFRYR